MLYKGLVKTILVLIVVLMQITVVYAAFSDVPQGAPGYEAVNRVSELKIMGGDDKGLFRPNSYITREQFAKIIVKALGKEEEASQLKSAAIFSDISTDRWSAGYINYSSKQGIINGKSDGLFSPEDEVTFAEACTLMVRSTGVNSLAGNWPNNFIEEAERLEFTKDMAFSSDDKLPRWASAKMIDRLWVLLLAKGEWKGSLDVSQLNSDLVILADSNTSSDIPENQVLTDKGMYYVKNTSFKLLPGGKYKLAIDKDTIVGVNKSVKKPEYVVVSGIINNEVRFLTKGGKKDSFILPDKTVYYYNGTVQTYSKVKDLISLDTTLAMAKNDTETGYEYVVIFDPQYSKPEVVIEELGAPRLGDIKFTSDLTIVRDGKVVEYKDLEAKDVVYKVTDIHGKNPYILVKNNYFDGKITDIKPNKLSPKVVQINGVDYDLNKYFNTARLDGTKGSFKKDSMVSVLLGYDGKVVDLFDDSMKFAFVLNNETTVDNPLEKERKTQYNAKLLLSDGKTVTYEVNADPSILKGQLVKYSLADDGKFKLDFAGNMHFDVVDINKEERKIGENDVADNVKIYNMISNPSTSDAVVSLIDWDDMPSGKIDGSKIRYIGKTGDFEDVNLIVTSDIFNESVKIGYIKQDPTFRYFGGNVYYSYLVTISGTAYPYQTEKNDLQIGDACLVGFQNSQVVSVQKVLTDKVTSKKIQAISAKRVKVNDRIYKFSPNHLIYNREKNGNIKMIESNEVDKTKDFENVTLYFDRKIENGGRVMLMVVQEK